MDELRRRKNMEKKLMEKKKKKTSFCRENENRKHGKLFANGIMKNIKR
jgi:hypothetical protein